MTQPRKATWPATLLKRNGREVPFDPGKIERAIAAAGQATGEFDPQQAQALAERVVERLPERACLDIERVQDLVERVLMEAGHYPTARAYVVYRERHGRLRRERKTLVDVAASMNEYLSREDWRVRANANQGYSLGGLILNVSGKVTANYWLDEVYDADIAAAHRDADLHIHDLDMLAGYCAGWSLRTLLNEGLNGVPGRVEAGPPKHLGSALGQMVNFLGTLQNEWAGAQAFSSFDTYLAPYVRKDRLDYASVRQALQEFIYNLNVPSRWGTQTPFTNLTFDWVCPDDLRDQVPRIGGEEMPFAYGEPAGRDGPDQPRLHRGDAGRRCPRPGIHLPDPDLQHHPRLPLGQRQRHAPVRDDRALRPALLPELPQLGHAAQPGALDVLPPATGRARTAQAWQRPVRLGGADRLAGRGDDQLRAPGLSPPWRRRRPLPPKPTTCSNSPSPAWS